MPSSYSSSGVAGRPSNRLAPKITTSSSSASRTSTTDYPASSRYVTETKYRTGTAGNFYTSVKDVPSSRGGPSTVLVQQGRSSTQNKK